MMNLRSTLSPENHKCGIRRLAGKNGMNSVLQGDASTARRKATLRAIAQSIMTYITVMPRWILTIDTQIMRIITIIRTRRLIMRSHNKYIYQGCNCFVLLDSGERNEGGSTNNKIKTQKTIVPPMNTTMLMYSLYK